MWYVLWTTTGREESTREMVQTRIDPKLFSRVAVPYKRKKFYRAGKGEIVTTILFPSYVFVETDRIEDFVTAVKCLPGFNVILHTDDFYCPISRQEEYFLTKLMNDRDIIDISSGYREGERIIVTSGPLKNLEGEIKKIIARRGTAILEMNVFGRSVEVRLGLELVEKRTV